MNRQTSRTLSGFSWLLRANAVAEVEIVIPRHAVNSRLHVPHAAPPGRRSASYRLRFHGSISPSPQLAPRPLHWPAGSPRHARSRRPSPLGPGSRRRPDHPAAGPDTRRQSISGPAPASGGSAPARQRLALGHGLAQHRPVSRRTGGRRGRRAPAAAHLLLRRRRRRRLEDHRWRRELDEHHRRPAEDRLGGRHRRRALGPQRDLRRDGGTRDSRRDDLARRWCLQVH